jgi:nicotinamidase-related amidase
MKKCLSFIFLPMCFYLACDTELQLSGEKAIISFRLPEFGISGTVNNMDHTVSLSVPMDVDISNLAPEITVSAGASINPPSLTLNNFMLPQDYTVTAEDGSTQDYAVTVTEDSAECLLVVDVQNLIFTWGIYRPETLLTNLRTLIDGAHGSDCLLIYIQQTDDDFFIVNSEGWQIHVAVEPTEEDIVIQKNVPNSFTNTDLNSILHANHIGKIYVTGLVSFGCVEATCRGGDEMGYRVMLVRDAHSSTILNPEQLIEQTNTTLQNEGIVELIYTEDVVFQ